MSVRGRRYSAVELQSPGTLILVSQTLYAGGWDGECGPSHHLTKSLIGSVKVSAFQSHFVLYIPVPVALPPSLIPLVSSSNSSSPCLPLLLFLLFFLLLLLQRPPPPLLPQTSGGGVSGSGPPSTLTTAEREGNKRRVSLRKGRHR